MLKWFWRLCLCGFLGSLLLWSLPTRVKKYHFDRYHDDYKSLFVEHTTEYGLAANGIVYSHHVMAYEILPYSGKTPAALDPIRLAWYKTGSRSKIPWPIDSNRIEYDEWGPSRWHSPDGLLVTQVGSVYCLPYSVIALICACPLLLRGVRYLRHRPPKPHSNFGRTIDQRNSVE